jgi:DNA polymerase-3 subunit epsilon
MTDAPWFAGPMTAFDLETTGTDVESDHVVTAAVISLGGGQKPKAWNWMAAVEIDIPAEATKIHRISTGEARKDGRPPVEVLDEVADLLAASLAGVVPIVGHNVVYDLTLLDRELRRKGLPTLQDRCNRQGPVICTRVLDQHVLKFRRKPEKQAGEDKAPGPRTLKHVSRVYGLGWDEKAAHGCEYDALQAARVAYKIGQIAHTRPDMRPEWVQAEQSQKFGDLTGIDLVELFIAQQQWAFEQAAELQTYFRTKATPERGGDPNKVIDGSWPTQPFRGAS